MTTVLITFAQNEKFLNFLQESLEPSYVVLFGVLKMIQQNLERAPILAFDKKITDKTFVPAEHFYEEIKEIFKKTLYDFAKYNPSPSPFLELKFIKPKTIKEKIKTLENTEFVAFIK